MDRTLKEAPVKPGQPTKYVVTLDADTHFFLNQYLNQLYEARNNYLDRHSIGIGEGRYGERAYEQDFTKRLIRAVGDALLSAVPVYPEVKSEPLPGDQHGKEEGVGEPQAQSRDEAVVGEAARR